MRCLHCIQYKHEYIRCVIIAKAALHRNATGNSYICRMILKQIFFTADNLTFVIHAPIEVTKVQRRTGSAYMPSIK